MCKKLDISSNDTANFRAGCRSVSNKTFWGKTSLLPTRTVHEFYVEFVIHQERSPAFLQELRQRHLGLSWGNEDATRPTTLTLFACLLLFIWPKLDGVMSTMVSSFLMIASYLSRSFQWLWLEYDLGAA